MWQCQKCGEGLDDSFDTCWKCRKTKYGVEDPDFELEADVAQAGPPRRRLRRLNGFWVAAFVTAVVSFINYLVPLLGSMSDNPRIRRNLGLLLVMRGIQSLFVALGGGLAGWIGEDTDRIADAAARGAFTLLLVQGPLIVITAGIAPFFGRPAYVQAAVLLNIAALGAIAGSIGRFVGKLRSGDGSAKEPLQWSIGEMLFVTFLFSLLFASGTVLSR